MLTSGGHHFSKTISESFCMVVFHWYARNFTKDFRFDADDCVNEEELPDFSPLGDFSLHPELQVK